MIKMTLNSTDAKLKNVNLRLEKHGQEEKVLGTDINITAAVDADFLNSLAVGEDMDYKTFLFDEKGQVKASGIKAIAFDREYVEHNVSIAVPSLHDDKFCELHDVKICKLSASPDFGNRVNLSLQVQCHPSEEQHAFLHEAWKDGDISLTISEPKQGDLVNALDDEAQSQQAGAAESGASDDNKKTPLAAVE